jgi:hypothetical protein
VAVALTLLYVLGVGPTRRTLGSSWWTIYRPVFAIARQPQMGKPLAWYINLWTDKSYRAIYDPVDGIGFLDNFTIN